MDLPAWIRRPVKARMSRGLRNALRVVAREWRIQRLHRASLADAATLLGPPPVRLNLACGHHPKAGWINVDLFGPGADLRLDLREPMPFPDASVDYIYTEHFFEHLNYPNLSESMGWQLEGPREPSEAMTFLRECHRILKVGGILDMVVPDAEVMVGEYVRRSGPGVPADWWGPRWCDTAMHRVNYLFRQGREHKYAYDEETLSRLALAAGFAAPTRRPFDAALDQPNHAIGSLCLVAARTQ